MFNFFQPHKIVGAITLSTAAICAVSSAYVLTMTENLPASVHKEMKNNLHLSLLCGICGMTILFKESFLNTIRDYTGLDINQYLLDMTGNNVRQYAENLDNQFRR